MYIDDYKTVINGKKYRRALIRESYREGEKVNKRTLANIAHASDSQIEAIKVALKEGDGDRYFIFRTPNIPVKGGEKRG